jgi:hypothetical protein
MGAVILGLGILSPAVHHYMIAVPKEYSINWPRAAKFLWELLLDSPLFLVLVVELVFFGEGLRRAGARVRWLLAVLAVAIPMCIIAFAKVGGWPNSLLPALLGMMAFCVLRLPRMLRRIEERARSVPAQLALGTLLAILLLMTTFPHLTWEKGLVVPWSRWDKDYRAMLGVVRGLPGTVVCPEDPTIPFYASGYVGLNLFSEKDARADRGQWPHELPKGVIAEMRNADYLVDIYEYWGENVDEPLLLSLGFQAMDVESIDPDCYRIWRRGNRPMTSSGSTRGDQVGELGPERGPFR